jgi:hypothetical protein
VGPRHGLEDVVDPPVIGRVHPREERRPRRPRVGWDGRAQDVLLPPVDQCLQVRQVTPLEERVEDAPVGAVPSDEDLLVACGIASWQGAELPSCTEKSFADSLPITKAAVA